MNMPEINVQQRVRELRSEIDLRGDTENHERFQAAAKRVHSVWTEFEEAETELIEQGHLTDEGRKAAMEQVYEKQKEVLDSLVSQVVDTAESGINTGIAALPEPKLPQLTDLDRHRIIEAFTRLEQTEMRKKMLMDALGGNANLAYALAREEGAITGLPQRTREDLMRVAAEDPAAETRATLNQQLTAAQSLRQTINDIDERMKGKLL